MSGLFGGGQVAGGDVLAAKLGEAANIHTPCNTPPENQRLVHLKVTYKLKSGKSSFSTPPYFWVPVLHFSRVYAKNDNKEMATFFWWGGSGGKYPP